MDKSVRVMLDYDRNKLQLADVKLRMAIVSLAGGTFVTSLYAMNLNNFLQTTSSGFLAVVAVATLVACSFYARKLYILRRTGRRTMQRYRGFGFLGLH